jgi:hypothetical protein
MFDVRRGVAPGVGTRDAQSGGMDTTHLLRTALLAASLALPACGENADGLPLRLTSQILVTAPFGASPADAAARLQAQLELEDCTKPETSMGTCPYTPQTPAMGAQVKGGANGSLSPLEYAVGGCLSQLGPMSPEASCWSGSLSGYPSTYDFEASEAGETLTTTLVTWTLPSTSFARSGLGESTTATITWSGWPSDSATLKVVNDSGDGTWASFNEYLTPSAQNVIDVPSTAFPAAGHYEAHLLLSQGGETDEGVPNTAAFLDFVASLDVAP